MCGALAFAQSHESIQQHLWTARGFRRWGNLSLQWDPPKQDTAFYVEALVSQWLFITVTGPELKMDFYIKIWNPEISLYPSNVGCWDAFKLSLHVPINNSFLLFFIKMMINEYIFK